MEKIIGIHDRDQAGRRQSFIDGALASGYKIENLSMDRFRNGEYYSIATFFWNSEVRDLHEECNRTGRKSIHVECGYTSKNPVKWYSITRNGIMAYGKHDYERNLPNDRWKKLGIPISPWRKNGDIVLIAHQHARDRNDNDRQHYFDSVITFLVKNTKKQIVVAIHPEYKNQRISYCCDNWFNKWKNMGVVFDNYGIFGKLRKSYCLVTYDSNAAIDSIINGVPVIVCKEAKTMAHMVANYNIENIKNLQYPDRTAWCNWIAYQQWTECETKLGLPFKYIFK